MRASWKRHMDETDVSLDTYFRWHVLNCDVNFILKKEVHPMLPTAFLIIAYNASTGKVGTKDAGVINQCALR